MNNRMISEEITFYTRDSFWRYFFYSFTVTLFFCMKLMKDFFAGNLRLNTTLCWPRAKFNITADPTLNWEQLAVNTSVSAPCPSQILEILTSSVHSQKANKVISCERTFFYNKSFIWRILFVFIEFIGKQELRFINNVS